MATLTANGSSVQSMRLRLPFRGVWIADLVVDADSVETVTGAVTIEAGGERFVGFAKRPGADPGGQVTVRVVGGAGNLTTQVAPASYTSVTVREVVAAILSAAGETLSDRSDAGILSRQLTRWGRARGEAASALSALCKALGCAWRVLDNGSVWLGVDTFAAVEVDSTVTAEKPEQGLLEVALDDFVLRPGQRFGFSNVYDVSYLVGVTTRATLSTIEGGGAAARADAKKMERGLAEAGFSFVKTYSARVTSQNSDGTVEVKLDDAKEIASISKVPLRHGLPGVTRLELAPQAQVLVGFDDGDQQRPYAALPLKGGRMLHLTIDCDVVEVGGTDAVAIAARVEERLAAIELWGTTVTPPLTAMSNNLASEKLFTE